MLAQAGVGSSLSRLMVAIFGPAPGLKHDRTLSIFIHHLIMGTQNMTFGFIEEQICFGFPCYIKDWIFFGMLLK